MAREAGIKVSDLTADNACLGDMVPLENLREMWALVIVFEQKEETEQCTL